MSDATYLLHCSPCTLQIDYHASQIFILRLLRVCEGW